MRINYYYRREDSYIENPLDVVLTNVVYNNKDDVLTINMYDRESGEDRTKHIMNPMIPIWIRHVDDYMSTHYTSRMVVLSL